ncbi:MAG: hypothetical protein AB9866_30770 [Syntrophobacteraceae bacterium]
MRYRSFYKLIPVQTILVLAFFFTTTADICSAQDRGGFSSEGPASSGELSAAAYDSQLGSTVSATQFSSMRCTPVKVTVGWMGAHTVMYYQCGANWYTRAYSGRVVSYVLVQPPTDADF